MMRFVSRAMTSSSFVGTTRTETRASSELTIRSFPRTLFFSASIFIPRNSSPAQTFSLATTLFFSARHAAKAQGAMADAALAMLDVDRFKRFLSGELPKDWDKSIPEFPADKADATRNASGVVLPTVWVTLGKVQPAAEPSGGPAAEPTLPIWAQLQKQIGDLDDLKTYNKDNLVAAINEARQSGGGGGGGGISSAQIDEIRVLTKSDYDALDEKDARTLYLVEG